MPLHSDEVFLSFLIGISTRILANNKRKKKPELYQDVHNFDVIDHGSTFDKTAEVQSLYYALSQLSDVLRECIILFEVSGFSIKEIMKIQNASGSTVKQRLRRARQRLAKLLQQDTMLTDMKK